MHIYCFSTKIQLELGKVAAGENNFLTETLNTSKRLCVGGFDRTCAKTRLQQQKPKRPKASFLKMVVAHSHWQSHLLHIDWMCTTVP